MIVYFLCNAVENAEILAYAITKTISILSLKTLV